MEIKYFCSFKGGKPILNNPKEFMDVCRKYDGKQGFITVHKEIKKKTKSYEQQKYYFGIVIAMISEHCGFEKNEKDYVHQAISRKFLSEEKNGLVFVKSTALDKWTTFQWEEYMERVRRWALIDLALLIPLPNEILTD